MQAAKVKELSKFSVRGGWCGPPPAKDGVRAADFGSYEGRPAGELALPAPPGHLETQWGDKASVLAAVSQPRQGWVLSKASEKLKGDREVVLAAVAEGGASTPLIRVGGRGRWHVGFTGGVTACARAR